MGESERISTSTHKQLERRAIQLQAAAEVSRAASSILDPDELIQQTVDLVRERFSLYYVGLFLVDQTGEWTDERGKWAVLRAGTGEAGQQMVEQVHKLEVGGASMIGWCVANKQARIVLDVGEEAVRFDNPLLPETRSELALPLISRGQVIGAMTVQSAEEVAFSDADIATLQIMADQLANAIENARLFEETTAQTQELMALTETTSKLVSMLELDAVLDSIMDAVLELFQAQQACFIMMDPDGYLRMKRHRGLSEEFVRRIVGRPGEGFYGKVYQSGEPILITDARKELDPDTAEAVLQEGVISFVHVPVEVRGETVAVLNLTSLEEGHRFDEGDLERLSSFADQAAIAIENARLYAESQQRLREQRRLARIAVLASSTLDIDELLAQLVQETAQLTEARTAVLLLLDEENQALVGRYLSTEGRLVSAPEDWRVPLDAPGFEQSIFARGGVYYTNHAQTDPNILPAYRSYIETLDAENFCGIALRARDRSIGELYVVNRRGGFGPEQLQLLRTATGYVANAIENARLFLEREQRITELVTLNEMSQALSSALTMDDLLETVYQHVNRRFDATNFYIATYEEASEEWTAVFDVEHGQRQPRTRYKVEAGVTGYIIRIGQPVLVHTQQESIAFDEERGIASLGPQPRSWMGVPLIAAGKVVGVMAIQSYEQEHLYSEQDVALFSTLGAQAAVAIENLRLLDETRRRARQLETINETGQAITSVLDLDAVLRQIVDAAKARFGHYYVSILLVEGDQLVFRDGSAIGDSATRLERRERVFDLQQSSLITEVVRTGQPVLINDVLSDSRYLAVPELAATRSELDVPIAVKDHVIGVLDVQSDQPNAFDQTDMALLQSLASQAGVAIENARLFQEHERRITELAIINEIGQVVSSALELDDLLETVHQQVSRIFDATNFYIAAYYEDADEWAMLLQLEHGELQPSVRRKVQAGLTGYIIRNHQPILLRSMEENDAFHEAQGIAPIGERAKSWMGVPLIAADKVVGVMAIQSYEQEHLYGDHDLALFSTVADQVSTALANLRLLEEARRWAQELEAINEVGRTVTSVLDPDAVLRRIVDTTKVRFDLYFICILLVEGEQLVLREGSTIGDSDARFGRGQLILDLDGPGLTTEAVRTGQPVLVSDIRDDPRYVFVPELADTLSELVVPVEVKGRVIGVLDMQSDHPNAFDQADVTLLQSLASQAGVAIENARLFEETRSGAEEMAVLNELGRALTARLNVAAVMNETYRQTTRLVDTTNFYIALYDPEREMVSFPIATESKERVETREDFAPRHRGRGLTEHIIDTGQPLLIERDVGGWLEAYGVAVIGPVAQSWLGVPLMIGDQVLGVMTVQSYAAPYAYGEHDRDMLMGIASQAAIALQNARLFEETRRRAEELAVLNELARALTARLSVEEVLEESYRGVSRLVDTTNFFIALYDREKEEINFVLNITESEIDKEVLTVIPVDQGISGYIIRNRTSVLVKEDVMGWQVKVGIEAVGDPALSWLGVPLLIGDRVLGVMAAQSYTTSHAYDEHDRDMLTAIASQAAIAIQNARLFEETQRRVHEMQLLHDASMAAASGVRLEEALQAAVEAVAAELGFPIVGIELLDPESRTLRVEAFVGYPLDVVANAPMPLGEGITGWVAQHSEPLLVPDVRLDPRYVETVSDTRSELCVPLIIGARVIGVLNIESPQPNAFTGDDLRLLNTLAGSLSVLVERARLFEETHRRAEELAVLNDLAQALTARLDMDQVLEEIYRGVVRLLDTKNFYVGLYEPEKHEIIFPLNVSESVIDRQVVSMSADEGLSGYVVRSRTSVLIEEDIPGWLEKVGVELIGSTSLSWLGAPLMLGDQVLGMMAVQSYTTPRAYDEHDRDILVAIASQAAIALQNARLFEETQARARELAVLNEMSRDLAMKLDVDAAIESAHRHTSRLMDTTNFYVALYDAQQDEISFPFYAEGEEIRRGGSRRSGKGMTEHIIRLRKPLLVKENVTAQLGKLGIELIGQESESWLGVPLMIGERVIGVVAVQSYTTPRLYDEHHRDLLSAVASQLAIAVENARLFEETQRSSFLLGERVKELNCLNDIGRKIDEAPSIPEFLQWTAERIPAAMQYPEVCTVAIEFEGQVYGTSEAMNLPYQIVQGLRVGGEQVGQVYVAYTERRDFPDAASALLGDIVRRMSGYIESRRLFEETRRRTAELQVLHEIALQLGTELGTAELLRLIVEQAVALLGAEAGGFYFYDPRSDELVFSVAVGYFAEFTGNRIKPGEGLAGQVFQSRQPLAVEDYGAWSGRSTVYEQEPRLKTVLGVPVLGREGVLGVLDIGGGEKKRAFDEHDIWLAELFAAQSAVALENTRLFESVRARADRERLVRTITERVRQGRDTEAITRIALEELGWMLGASTSIARLGTREQLLADQEPPAREAKGGKEGA